MTTIYLVRAVDEQNDDGSPLWWSNEAGWSTLDYALVFTEAEQRTLNLPFGGTWVRFTSEVEVLQMFALLSTQGTAMHETALCVECMPSPAAQALVIGDAHQFLQDWNRSEDFTDVTGNDAVVCQVCGRNTFGEKA